MRMSEETERTSPSSAPHERSRQPPTVSVLIATRDRADKLRGTLASLCTPANMDLPDWEIVVADNGSSDETVQVCQEFAAGFPGRVHWLVEDRQGKSNALNAGLLSVEGDVVAMTDDDVICAPDFLVETKRVFSDSCERGYRTVYAPSIVVRDQVPAGRVTPDFLRARYFGIGRSYAYYSALSRSIWRFGLYALKDVLLGEFKALRLRRTGEAAEAVRRQCASRQRLGFFWQHLLFRLGVRDRKLTYLDSGSAPGVEMTRG